MPLAQGTSFSDYLPLLLQGIPITLELTFSAITLVIISGFALGLGRSSRARAIRWPSAFVVEFFRGSSAIVQLFWAFYVLPFFGIDLPPFVAGILVLGLNGGAYFSEVVRASFASVPKGQTEAAAALDLSAWFRLDSRDVASGTSLDGARIWQRTDRHAQVHCLAFVDYHQRIGLSSRRHPQCPDRRWTGVRTHAADLLRVVTHLFLCRPDT